MDNVLPPLVQQMLQPGFYPHTVKEPIALLQTHISYVFLTGDLVYKLKKPVDFGFLDYSTLEKRRHFCQEELRLNQRGTQDLYRQVLPISWNGEQYVLNDNSAPVEYTLQMVEFPQAALLNNMLATDLVTPALMTALGAVVATFHQLSQTNEYISSFGAIPQLRQSIDENYQQTEKYIGAVQTAEQFQATKAFTDRFLTTQAAIFAERQQGQFIREGHGDLHLGNICYWPDRLQLFDCIEFNESYRYVDTMYDVAFATMDLTAKGRTDLGNVFLNTYLEHSGDWAGLKVLPFYLCRQAYVRAKVASFTSVDPGITAIERAAAQQTAHAYYRLAWQYTQVPPGRILMMAGLSGSGKSTLARQIAPRLNAIHLRSDAIRKHLGGVALTTRGSAALYTPAMTTRTYDRLQTLGIQLAQQGYTVILDAKFDRRSLRAGLLQAGLPVKIIHCQAPTAVLVERLNQRTGDIADATAPLLASQQAAWEDFTAAEAAAVISINTTDTIQDLSAFCGQL